MKILVLSMNYAPELTGIGKYSRDMVEGLVDRGHEVTVVCAPPYYPSWRVAPGYQAAAFHRETPRRGLTVLRCPVWVPRRPGGLKRLLHLASFALSSAAPMALMAAWRPDAVVAVMPSTFAAPGALLAARLSGATAWLHVQDFEVDAAFELGLLEGASMRQRVLSWERQLLGAFDMVSTISQRMHDTLLTKGVPAQRAGLVPNGVDVRAVRPDPGRSAALRAELGIRSDQCVCLFAGTMNRKQGMHMLLDAARELQHRDDVVFMLSGDGEFRAALESAAIGLPNVRFQGLCAPERLNELLNLADIHLLPQLRGATDLVMPSKLTGMLASGRPVIAAARQGTEIARVVTGRGVVIEPECAASLAQAVRTLCDDPTTRQHLGAAAREFALQQLDQSVLLDRFDAQLRQRVRGSAPAFDPAAA